MKKLLLNVLNFNANMSEDEIRERIDSAREAGATEDMIISALTELNRKRNELKKYMAQINAENPLDASILKVDFRELEAGYYTVVQSHFKATRSKTTGGVMLVATLTLVSMDNTYTEERAFFWSVSNESFAKRLCRALGNVLDEAEIKHECNLTSTLEGIKSLDKWYVKVSFYNGFINAFPVTNQAINHMVKTRETDEKENNDFEVIFEI